MVDQASFRLFLSAVSSELGEPRREAARVLRRKGLEVREQAHFSQGPATLLERLNDYIAACDAVICLVGRQRGAAPEPPQVARLLERLGPIAPFEAYRAAAGDGAAPSYTQWEYLLARHHRRPCYLFLTEPPDPAADPGAEPGAESDQAAWHRWLRGQGDHYDPLDDTGLDGTRRFLEDLLVLDLPDLSRPPPIALPYRSRGALFMGREGVLAELRASLTAQENQATAIAGQAIHGLGGVGKSRLAVEYAWRHQADYTALLFIAADSPEALDRNLAALCGPEILDLPEQAAPEEPRQRAAVLRWLQSHPGWLLILDNIDSAPAAAAVDALLPQLPLRPRPEGGGHLLLTGRLGHWGPGIQPLPLESLAPADAAAFLLARTDGRRRRADDDPAQAAQLAAELGHLALGLEQAGAYINQRRLTFAAYRAEWEGHRARVLAWYDERLMQYPSSLAVTWQTSVDRLSPAARRLLERLAWLAPDPIPESLLELPVPVASAEALAAEAHGDADGSDPGADSGADDPGADRGADPGADPGAALAELEAYSLITRDPKRPEFTLHRLVQAVTRETLDPATQAARRRDALGWVNAAFVGDPDDVRSWPRLDPLSPHALAVAQQADQAAILEPTARLLNELGILFSAKARHGEAEPLMRRALAIDEASLGPDHPKVALRLNNLATLLQATNRLAEAEPLMRRALTIDEASYGSDHPGVARDLNNLAALLQATNRLAEAEPLMRRALTIDEASLGPDHPNVASTLNNLATLLKATNRLAEAEPLMRRALTIDGASYGPDHPNVARHLNNLAQLLQATNRLAEAEPLMRRALTIDEASLGPDHPDVALRLNNLAQWLQATNRLAEAEPLMRRVVEIFEKALGPEHPNVATALNNLAQLLQATNRLAEAEPLMRRVVEIFEKVLGPEHPNVATALNNLAQLLQATNRLAEAEPLMRRALTIDEASYGPDHPNIAIRLNNLALLLQATNRLAEAEPLMRRVVEILEKAISPDHPNVATALNNLAQLLKATNRLAEAEPLMGRAVAILEAFQQQTGHPRPEATKFRANLAALQAELAAAPPTPRTP